MSVKKRTFAEKFTKKIHTNTLNDGFPYYTEENQEEPHEIYTSREISHDMYSMDIDELINILTDLKKDGANRAYLDYHIDHAEYEISGVKIIEL